MRGNSLAIKSSIPHFASSGVALWFLEKLASLARKYQCLVHWWHQGSMSSIVVHFLHNRLLAQDLALSNNIEPCSGSSTRSFLVRENRHCSFPLGNRSSVHECAWTFFELWDWVMVLSYYRGSQSRLLLRMEESLALRAQSRSLQRRFSTKSGLRCRYIELGSWTHLLSCESNFDTSTNLGAWLRPEIFWLLEVFIRC